MKSILKPLTFVVLIALAGCVSGRPETTSYTSSTTGKTTLIESDKEGCERSCNDSNSRCMDTQAASNPSPGMPAGMFGASGQCRDELKSCLSSCKSR